MRAGRGAWINMKDGGGKTGERGGRKEGRTGGRKDGDFGERKEGEIGRREGKMREKRERNVREERSLWERREDQIFLNETGNSEKWMRKGKRQRRKDWFESYGWDEKGE